MESPTSMISADQMLREIQSESLPQLLASVQYKTKPPGSTSIKPLDLYLSPSTGAPNVSSLKSGDAIYVQGHPGSGKTHILYFLVATCVMPMDHFSVFIGGWNKVAFVIDMDGHFQISRFRDILVSRLQLFLPPQSITPVVEHSLQCVHIFRPTSSDQLSATLAHFPKYHAKHFPNIELGMIAVHSIDALYWLDRFKAEQLRSSLRVVASQSITSTLESLRSSYGLITVLTNWGLPQQLQFTLEPNRDQQSIAHSPNPTAAAAVNMSAGSTAICLTPRKSPTSVLTEDDPSSGDIQWLAQASGNPQSCTFTCQIRGAGMVIQ